MQNAIWYKIVLMKTKNIKKILILRFGAIGDVVHSTALFRSIKKKYPYISIHYVSFKIPSLNIQHDPDLDKVWISKGKTYKQLYKLAKILKKEKFDVFINLQPGIRTRIFAFMLGVNINLIYKKTFKQHAVKNFWETGKNLFKNIEQDKELKLYINEDVKNKVAGMIDEINKKKLIIAFNMAVSPTRQGRKWPLEYWQELAKKFLEKYECKIILTGSDADKNFSENLLDISPKIKSFCGKVSIEENTALLSFCNLVISGDTGPLHIATAVKTPVIGLYGAAPISRTGPYGENCIALHSNRLCVPCNKRKCKYLKHAEIYTPCLIDIKPDLVLKAAENFLKKE